MLAGAEQVAEVLQDPVLCLDGAGGNPQGCWASLASGKE